MPALVETDPAEYTNHGLNQLDHQHQQECQIDQSENDKDRVCYPLARAISYGHLLKSVPESSHQREEKTYNRCQNDHQNSNDYPGHAKEEADQSHARSLAPW